MSLKSVILRIIFQIHFFCILINLASTVEWVKIYGLDNEYHFGPDETTWNAANSYCRKLDSDLVTPDTEKKNSILFKYIRKKFGLNRSHYTSGRLIREKEVWMWEATGNRVKFTDWCREEPNDWAGKETCIEMDARRNCWNDHTCTDTSARIFGVIAGLHPLCEKYTLGKPWTETHDIKQMRANLTDEKQKDLFLFELLLQMF